MKDNRMSVTNILYKLFGEIEPYGNETIDKERYQNIQKYYEALCFIVSKLEKASKLKDRPELSIQKIAKECNNILVEFGIEEES